MRLEEKASLLKSQPLTSSSIAASRRVPTPLSHQAMARRTDTRRPLPGQIPHPLQARDQTKHAKVAHHSRVHDTEVGKYIAASVHLGEVDGSKRAGSADVMQEPHHFQVPISRGSFHGFSRASLLPVNGKIAHHASPALKLLVDYC